MNRFATTHWTAVLDAAEFEGEHSVDALVELCKNYWYPLYAFSRSLGDVHPDAQDLTQGFFQHLFERRLIADVHPSRGRFRGFLLTCFKNYRSAQSRRERTQKRGGEWVMTSYDALNAAERFGSELIDAETPEILYDRSWAITVLDRAHDRLQKEYGAAAKQQTFGILRCFIQGSDEFANYEDAAAKLNKSKDAVKMEVSRMRKRFAELLREIVNETVDDARDVEEELRYLLRLLSR